MWVCFGVRETMRLLPKLISSYSELIEKNFVYVDKTKFIELIEKRGLKVPLFLRPGRFGKTLFTEEMILKSCFPKLI